MKDLLVKENLIKIIPPFIILNKIRLGVEKTV